MPMYTLGSRNALSNKLTLDTLLVAEDAYRALEAARHERGWTQADVAARLDLTPSRVSQIESGNDTSLISFLRVAEGLEMTVEIKLHPRNGQRVAATLPPAAASITASRLATEIPFALNEWRIAAGLHQREVADRMCLSQTRVAQIERGLDRSYISVEKFAAAIGAEVVFDIRPKVQATPIAEAKPTLPEPRPRVVHPVSLINRLLGTEFQA